MSFNSGKCFDEAGDDREQLRLAQEAVDRLRALADELEAKITSQWRAVGRDDDAPSVENGASEMPGRPTPVGQGGRGDKAFGEWLAAYDGNVILDSYTAKRCWHDAWHARDAELAEKHEEIQSLRRALEELEATLQEELLQVAARINRYMLSLGCLR